MFSQTFPDTATVRKWQLHACSHCVVWGYMCSNYLLRFYWDKVWTPIFWFECWWHWAEKNWLLTQAEGAKYFHWRLINKWRTEMIMAKPCRAVFEKYELCTPNQPAIFTAWKLWLVTHLSFHPRYIVTHQLQGVEMAGNWRGDLFFCGQCRNTRSLILRFQKVCFFLECASCSQTSARTLAAASMFQ